MKYAQKVTELTERKIDAILPKKFLLALFVRFLNDHDEVQEILLARSPLGDESDLGAESHAQFIMDTLELSIQSLTSSILPIPRNSQVLTISSLIDEESMLYEELMELDIPGIEDDNDDDYD
jgi:hypothetical protein